MTRALRGIALLATLVGACSGVTTIVATAANPVTPEVTVDTTADTVGTAMSDTTPNCASPCSLRKAIQYANRDLRYGSTVIHLPAGDYVLTRPQDDSDLASGGDLSVYGRTRIVGAGAATTIIEQSPNVAERVFEVYAPLQVSGVTIRNGRANGDGRGGGGILVQSQGSMEMSESVVTHNQASIASQGFDSGYGGGIGVHTFPGHTVVLHEVTISANNAEAGGGGVDVKGGSLTIYNSTISANTCSPAGTCHGGGAFTSAALNLTNDTIDGNTADQGGGLYSDGGNALVTNVTFSANAINSNHSLAVRRASRGQTTVATPLNGAAIFAQGYSGLASVTLANSIISGNPLDECGQATDSPPQPQAPLTSGGSNIDDGASCLLTATGDQPATDAHLGALKDNGGPTLTRAIGPGSPALDAVKGTCPPPARDQRDVPRASAAARSGSACDIGAYEYQAPAPVATPSPSPTAIVQDVIVYVPYTPRLPEAGSRPARQAPAAGALLALVLCAGALIPLAGRRVVRSVRRRR